MDFKPVTEDEEYKHIVGFDNLIQPCAICGESATLWEFKKGISGPQKTVMCTNNNYKGQEIDCPMFMPPEIFYYRATIREAIKAWNEARSNKIVPINEAKLKRGLEAAKRRLQQMIETGTVDSTNCSFTLAMINEALGIEKGN